MTAILLVLLGSTLPALWPALDWRHSVRIRPATRHPSPFGLGGAGGYAADCQRACDHRLLCYYVAYAAGHIEFINEDQLWALVAFTVFASTVIHGATSFVVERVAPAEPHRAREAI